MEPREQAHGFLGSGINTYFFPICLIGLIPFGFTRSTSVIPDLPRPAKCILPSRHSERSPVPNLPCTLRGTVVVRGRAKNPPIIGTLPSQRAAPAIATLRR